MGLQEVKRGYRDEAGVKNYDSRFSGLRGKLNNRMVLKAIQKASGKPPVGGAVIDVPCGTGRLQETLRKLGPTISIQADISLEMLLAARKKQEQGGGGSHFVQCDVTLLPFRDKTFRAAFNVRFMQHLEPGERVATLKELNRVSAKLIVCYYHKYTFKTFSRTLRRRVGLYGKIPVKASRGDLHKEAGAAGLEVERIRRVVPLFSDNWVVELLGPRGPATPPPAG